MNARYEKIMNDYIAAGEWAKAEKQCQKALARDPGNHWWLIHLGLTLIETKRYPEAKEALDEADQATPHCPLVAWYKGVASKS